MNRFESLFQTPSVSILRFSHCPHHECSDAEEVCSAHAINLVDTGSFGLSVEKSSWVLAAGAAFVSRPEMLHRYRHVDPVPSDVCISVRYISDSFIEDKRTAVPANNRLAFLRLRLTRLLEAADHLAIEEWADELQQSFFTTDASPHHLYRSRQLRWYASRIDAARNLLRRTYAESHSLTSLARAVGMSTFQFARVFHELTGCPPHRYLLRIRLQRALQLLRDGVSVTDSCYQCGFQNLSHFIRSFRRTFGCSPSRAKSLPLK